MYHTWKKVQCCRQAKIDTCCFRKISLTLGRFVIFAAFFATGNQMPGCRLFPGMISIYWCPPYLEVEVRGMWWVGRVRVLVLVGRWTVLIVLHHSQTHLCNTETNKIRFIVYIFLCIYICIYIVEYMYVYMYVSILFMFVGWIYECTGCLKICSLRFFDLEI